MIDPFDSLRVPQISFGYSQARMMRIAQIHVLPGHTISRIEAPTVKRSMYRPHQSPGRQSLDQRRCADEICFEEQRLPVPLCAKLFNAADVIPVDIAHFPAEQVLDVDLHHSSSSCPPPGIFSMMWRAIQIS